MYVLFSVTFDKPIMFNSIFLICLHHHKNDIFILSNRSVIALEMHQLVESFVYPIWGKVRITQISNTGYFYNNKEDKQRSKLIQCCKKTNTQSTEPIVKASTWHIQKVLSSNPCWRQLFYTLE